MWRYVFNGAAWRHHRTHPPALNPTAERLLRGLCEDGVARTSLQELTGDEHLLGRLQAYAYELESGQNSPPRRTGVDALPTSPGRPFLIEMLDSNRPLVDPRGLLAQFATQTQLKGLVDTYFGLTSKISDINIWRNIPGNNNGGAATQLWHRDLAEDRYLVKAFLYLEPVAIENGPFVFARGTHLLSSSDSPRGGTVHDGINYRVIDADRSATLDQQAEICTGPAGSLVLADVRGYHRGGLTSSRSRFLLQIRYTSATALRVKMLQAPQDVNPREWKRHLSYDLRRSNARTADAQASPANRTTANIRS